MNKCWFCNTNPGEHDFIVSMRHPTPIWTSSTTYQYKLADIEIPICQKCISIHNWKRKMRICYIAPLAIVIILGWFFGIKYENSPAVDERLINIIMVGTFILPVILVPSAEIFIHLRKKKKWPFDIRDTSDSSLLTHPNVNSLKRLGFEILGRKIRKKDDRYYKIKSNLSLK